MAFFNAPPSYSMASTQASPYPPLDSLQETARIITLDNGLVVIVQEDHSAPVVSAQAWCRTGSIHEGKWVGAGLSHVLEHMLFKGTKTRPQGRIDQEVQDVGGHMNAYTSFDRTVYWINVPNTGAEVALAVLADIMQNATLPEDTLEKELDVIRREMDMGLDDPGRRASRRLFETAYTASLYRHSIIGHIDIFNRLKREDIAAYYKERYAPNNCFFVIVGDIQTDAVEQQIREHFKESKSMPVAPVFLPPEPIQTARRELIEEAAIELGRLHFSWHIPEARHPDLPTLDVLAAILGNGRSSRLYKEVREKRAVVHSTDAWTYSPGDVGLFGSSAIIDGSRLAEARDAILHEIERLRCEPPTEAEILKARNQFIAGFLSRRKTMQGQAQDLGSNWLSAGDLNFSERYLERVKQTGEEELQRVARQYLHPEQCTMYALVPKGANPLVRRIKKKSGGQPISLHTLSNGLRVLLKEDHRLPFVEIRATFKGGALSDSVATSGACLMMSKLLLKGTSSRSAHQLAEEIERTGGSLDTYSANNSFGVNVETLSAEETTALDLFQDVLLNPTFPVPALDREKEIQLAAIDSQKDNLLQSTFQAVKRLLFGDDGYGLNTLGTPESLAGLNQSIVSQAHDRLLVPSNGVIAVFGDMNPASILESLETRFAAWPKGAPFQPTASARAAESGRRSLVHRDKKQAVLVIGFLGTSLSDPRRYALDIIQEACSDLGSRLFTRIREKLGLAYYVGAQNFSGLGTGCFSFYAGTHPDKAAMVEKELMDEVRLLCEAGLTSEELARSKAKITGHKKIAHQDLGTLAGTVALDELYGLGYRHVEEEVAFYESVTLGQVQECAKAFLTPNTAVIAVTCPASN